MKNNKLQFIIKILKYLGLFLSLAFMINLAISIIQIIVTYAVLLCTNINLNDYSELVQSFKIIIIYILFTIITARIISEKQYGENKLSGYLQIFIAFFVYTLVPFLFYSDGNKEFLYSISNNNYFNFGNIINLFFKPVCFLINYLPNAAVSILIIFIFNLIIYLCSFNLVFYKIYKKLSSKKDEKQQLSINNRIFFISISMFLLIFNSHLPILNNILYFFGYIFLYISAIGKSYIFKYHHDAVSYDEVKYNYTINMKIRKIFIFLTAGICLYWIITMIITNDYKLIFNRDVVLKVINLIMVVHVMKDISKYLEQNHETKIIKIINYFKYFYITYDILVLIIYVFYILVKVNNNITLITANTTISLILAISAFIVLFKISKDTDKILNIRKC